MSDFWPDAEPGRAEEPRAIPQAASPDAEAVMRRAVAGVMAIEDVTLSDGRNPFRVRGRLIMSAEEAFRTLRPQFEAVGYTPQLRHEDGQDVVRALPVVFTRQARRTPWLAIILLIITVVSVFWVGLAQGLNAAPIDVIAYMLTGKTIMPVPMDRLPTPAEFGKVLLDGVLYALALLGILGAHEMGHYLMARHHGVHTTVPFFVPMPFNILGTMGAVIAMREPAPNRRVQFDIGIAGPLAGLIVAVPVMVVGLVLSEVRTEQDVLREIPPSLLGATNVEVSEAYLYGPVPEAGFGFLHEGNSLLYLAIKYAVFGQILPQGDLDVWIHPVAFAAWAGFLVTALNLLPIGQLDGGHVLYGLFGDRMRWLRTPVIGMLVLLATAGTLAEMGIADLHFGWSGWWLWVFFCLLLLRNHAPVLDEITGLDDRRRALGVVMLVVFVLLFMPQPMVLESIPAGMMP